MDWKEQPSILNHFLFINILRVENGRFLKPTVLRFEPRLMNSLCITIARNGFLGEETLPFIDPQYILHRLRFTFLSGFYAEQKNSIFQPPIFQSLFTWNRIFWNVLPHNSLSVEYSYVARKLEDVNCNFDFYKLSFM